MSANSRDMNRISGTLPEMLHYVHSDVFPKLDVGIICLDQKDKVLCFNKVFQVLTGTTDKDIIGKDLNHLSSTLLKNYSSLFCHLLSVKQQANFDERSVVKIVTPDGCLKYFSCVFLPFFENGDRHSGIMCILKDETAKTVCSNECLFKDDELDASHLPFVSFLWKGDDVWSVEYVSDNVIQFGYDPEDFKSGKLSYADIIHPDHLKSVRQAADSCTGNWFSKEYMLLTANREPRWVLERSYAVRDENNDITHFHGAILDIDARKKFEKELESTNLRERYLSKLGEKALSCNDLNVLMNYAVKLVAKSLDVKYCSVMEMLPDKRFLMRYGCGFSNLCIGSVVVDKNEGSQAGYTVFSGKPLIIEDMRSETRFKVPRFLSEHGIVSGISVIIGSKEAPFGILCAHTDKKRKFIGHEVNFLQSVSTILAETIRLRESFSSLELYKNLVNKSTDYIMVLEAVSKKFVYVSDRVFQDLDYSESEIMDQNIFEPDCFMKGLDMSEVISKVADEGSLLVESEFTRKNGTSFPVDISFAFVENEGNVYVVLIGRNITERKKAHQILRESETKLSAIFDNASDLICLSDINGTILEVNRTMAERLFYRKSELLGMSIADITAPYVRLKVPDLIDEIREKDIITVEIDILNKDGNCVPMEINAQLIEFNGKKRLLSIGRDISERRILEKAIKEHSEQLEYSNEIKDMFADVTSHDLINSVSLIEGFVEYLSDIEDNDEKNNILAHIRNATYKLRKTIDSASVFARLNCSNDMDIQKMDLLLLFYNSLERLNDKVREKDIKIVLNSPEFPYAYINPIIEEVFFNLLSNAIKYSPAGSEVIVDIIEADDKWKVKVSDSGPGISDEDKLRIFGRFRRAGPPDVNGKGLGLAIAKMALKCHGEDLHVVNNEAGKGSTFWFTVRMSDGFEKSE